MELLQYSWRYKRSSAKLGENVSKRPYKSMTTRIFQSSDMILYVILVL